MLQEAKLIVPEFQRPSIQYPKMSSDAICDFHMGAKGHSLDECLKLKHKIQDLIEGGIISISEEGIGINVTVSEEGVVTNA